MKCKECNFSYCIEPYNNLLICNSKEIEKKHKGEVILENNIPFWCPLKKLER